MITFRNRGLVDLRAITTFGVNSKDTTTAIGQFGTGFKYAVAVALRLGARLTVWRGLERFEFTARRETIRNDEFDLVYMNDQQLGFTTHLGSHWEPWQAFRELYCNMLDEGGEASQGVTEPLEGETLVLLEGETFDRLWERRDDIVLPSKRKVLFANDNLEIIDGPSRFVYYRGVRVAEHRYDAAHTYNILSSMSLTEDRTVNGSFWQIDSVIRNAVRHMTDKTMLRRMLVCETPYERSLDYSYGEYSAEFFEVVHRARANKELNPLALVAYRVKNPEVTMPARVEKVERQEKKDLKDALALCAVLGYDLSANPIVITDELPDGVLGQVFPKHSEKIYIARRAFNLGLLTVAGTLLEEHIHLKFGLLDNSRDLQNHLLDVLMRAAQRVLVGERGGVVPLAPPTRKE